MSDLPRMMSDMSTRAQKALHIARKRRAEARLSAWRRYGRLRPIRSGVERAADGMPLLSPGLVYVTPAGRTFHPTLCDHVAAAWDQARDRGLWLVREREVGSRACCASCARALGLETVRPRLSVPSSTRG